MNYQKTIQFSKLRDVHFLNLINREDFPIPQILDLVRRQARLPAILLEPVFSIHTTVRQEDQVALDMAFGMMCVRDVSGEIVEFGAADGTDRGGD